MLEKAFIRQQQVEPEVYLNGADGGGRTHTLVRVLDFESSASANSATSAPKVNQYISADAEVNPFREAVMGHFDRQERRAARCPDGEARRLSCRQGNSIKCRSRPAKWNEFAPSDFPVFNLRRLTSGGYIFLTRL
jgi:hypothetical protein